MRSFSKRLTQRIVLALTLTMAFLIVGVFYQASWIMEVMTKAYYQNVAALTNESVEKGLRNIEVTVKNSIDEVELQLADPDKMTVVLRDRLQRNPSPVLGFGIGFEPNFYPEKGYWFEPYAVRVNGRIDTKQIGSSSHDYFDMDWYQGGLAADGGLWTDPYFDDSGAEMPLCTYTFPVHDAEGLKVGVFGCDISLNMLQDFLLNVDVKANTEGPIKTSRLNEDNPQLWVRSIIVGRNGNYISHPDKQRIIHRNFYKEVSSNRDTIADRMLLDMKAGRKGTAKIHIDGVQSIVFYSPLEHTGWSLAMILPVYRLKVVVIKSCIQLTSILLLGLLAVYFICRITIRYSTRPLHSLAESADEVAKGNFNAPLPDIRYDDEIRQLRDSFGNMQQSLSRYINELQTTIAQKSAFESELAIARKIQMAMLPGTFALHVSPSTLDLHAVLIPAKAVGGDLYDYFLRDNRLFFCIGDVSGKGIPAALMMAVMRAMFRSEARKTDTAATIVGTMNHNLCDEYKGGEFITMFVGILDLQTGNLDFCNAGHEAPLLCEESAVALPIKPNLPVGALSDWEYEGQQTQLQPGEMLFLYTDGLSEAMNSIGEQFGRKHVMRLVGERGTDTARHLVETMMTEVNNHVENAEQSDDITMLSIRWQPTQHLSPSTSHLTIRALMDDIAQLEPFIANVSSQSGFDEKEAKRLRLAVEEAVANVINYGEATTITLQATIEEQALTLTIDDDGKPFDPTQASVTDLSVPADQRPPGGMGIILMKQMTDGLSYQRLNNHNILKIKKCIIHN